MSIDHRKAAVKVQLTDKSGQALSNTDVNIKLTNHEFLFGCGAFDSLPATAEGNLGDIAFYQDRLAPTKEFYQDRVNKWLDVFNYGTIPFYWGGF